MNRDQVEKHLHEATPTFSYGGQVLYKFQHLGAFIDACASLLPEGDEQLPLVLVKAGEHSTALLVDEMLGNREIVVKSVGSNYQVFVVFPVLRFWAMAVS